MRTGNIRKARVQNKLRPEDIEKITYVFRNKLELDEYSRLVSFEELEREDFNFNIRRYVDNSPPSEPHDALTCTAAYRKLKS